MSKSCWKTTSVQDCGCQNQQKNAFSTYPMKKGEKIKIRVKPCAKHAPPHMNEDASFTYEEFWGLF